VSVFALDLASTAGVKVDVFKKFKIIFEFHQKQRQQRQQEAAPKENVKNVPKALKTRSSPKKSPKAEPNKSPKPAPIKSPQLPLPKRSPLQPRQSVNQGWNSPKNLA
jgi:hypothetical protein